MLIVLAFLLQGPKGQLERNFPDMCDIIQVCSTTPYALDIAFSKGFLCKLHAVVQEDNSLKVVKRDFTDPAKRRKAYAQHGLIRWVAAALSPCCMCLP